MEPMEFLQFLAGVAGAITAIWAAVALFLKGFRAAKQALDRRQERKNAPMKAILRQLEDQQEGLRDIRQCIGKMQESDQLITEKIESIQKSVKVLDDSVSTMQRERLNQGYEYYVEQGNPCPMSVKESLVSMYTQYHASGHNHLAESYIERLEACPTK